MSAPDVIERQQQAMQRLLMAATPGLLVLFWLYGWGVLINLLLAGTCAWAVEAGVRRLRGHGSSDLSGLVSAVLLALALPPYCPWWLCLGAVSCGLLLGKHLYGGKQNPFNPAMLGYALMLLAFPQPMTHWPASHGLDLLAGLQQVFGLYGETADAWALHEHEKAGKASTLKPLAKIPADVQAKLDANAKLMEELDVAATPATPAAPATPATPATTINWCV